MSDVFFPVFLYGQLMFPDRPALVCARGEMRTRGDDAAARFGGDYTGFVFGQVHWLDETELARIARDEKPEYDSVEVVVNSGLVCAAFAYPGVDWDDLPIVPTGRYRDVAADVGDVEEVGDGEKHQQLMTEFVEGVASKLTFHAIKR